jgi:hypothetical protein
MSNADGVNKDVSYYVRGLIENQWAGANVHRYPFGDDKKMPENLVLALCRSDGLHEFYARQPGLVKSLA